MVKNQSVNLTKFVIVLCIFIILTVSAKNEGVPTNQAKLGAAGSGAATGSKSGVDVKPAGLKPGHTFNAYKGGRICTRAKDMKYEFTQCSKALTTNVFFYYPRELHCDTRVGRSE